MDVIELFKQAAVAMQSDMRYLALDNEMVKDERDEAHINELNNRVSQLYQQVMNHEKMKDFNEAKAEAEKMVAHIDAIINTAMNGGDPMLVQEPQGGCSGSCSSGAGCH